MIEKQKPSKSQKTKALIVRKSLYLFENEGFETLTMRSLALECGLSLGAFYYYFKSKEEIVLEIFRASLQGHMDRTTQYLDSQTSSLKLAEAMNWICKDRFQEFDSYRTLLRVLAQRLDPQDPVSPWHQSSKPIREQSVQLFESVVSKCLPNLQAKFKRQMARALWLHHLAILGVWAFDRTSDSENAEFVLKHASRLWRTLPNLLRVPGMKTFLNLALVPLERFE